MQRFTEDEAQEILRRAVRAPLEGEYTQDDLRRSAEELGISPEALARAEAEVREDRLRQEFNVYRRERVRGEVGQFVSIIGILAVVNYVTSPEYWWFLWVIPWWGMSLIGTIRRAMSRDGEHYQRAFERWQVKRGYVAKTEALGS